MKASDYLAQGYGPEKAARLAARDAGQPLPQPTPKVNPLQAEVDQLRTQLAVAHEERDAANRGLAQALTEQRRLEQEVARAPQVQPAVEPTGPVGFMPLADSDFDAIEDALFQVTRNRSSNPVERREYAAALQARIHKHRMREGSARRLRALRA